MNTSLLTILIAAGYVFLLLLLSRWLGGKGDNESFFTGQRRSPWYAVAFGMIGASLSGVSFVSVPGWVMTSDMTYLQMCLGFVPGYFLVAFVLLPIYYHGGYTSIYSYLNDRFGLTAYRSGAGLFLLSKVMGAAIRLYLVCLILQHFVFDDFHIPYVVNAFVVLLTIWLYTRRSGIKAVVWTDTLQTFVLLLSLVFILVAVMNALDFDVSDAVSFVRQSPMSRVFVFDDFSPRQNFWKQFFSGVFIVIVMTGLDQDMMQKNLTCRTLRQSQLNMSIYGLLFVPVNLLFLSLGVLLVAFAHEKGIELPSKGDELLPMLCGDGCLGLSAYVLFTLGIIAAAFSSADSALTALTTSVCVDLFRKPLNEKLRRFVHPCIAILLFLVIMAVYVIGSSSVIDAVYTIAGYTYGPLLGLFAFGLASNRQPRASWIPWLCALSMAFCWGMSVMADKCFDYQFGYELLMLNGAITFCGLWLSSLYCHDERLA